MLVLIGKSQAGEVNPFGHEDENAEIKYRTMDWWHAGLRKDSLSSISL